MWARRRTIKFVEGAGATDVNGTTNFDRTNYFETMPSNQLELALWLESDRMGFLLERLDRTKLTNQRDVVRNERRQGEGHAVRCGGRGGVSPAVSQGRIRTTAT